MSSTAYKNNLTVGGPSLDKSKLQLRRPTPDSDVLASSDEDRDHVRPPIRQAPGSYSGGRRLSSSWLHDIQPNRKNSLPATSFADPQPSTPTLDLGQQSRPGTSSFAWNTNSFSGGQSGSRLREVLPSPTSAFGPERPLPSPTTIEIDSGIAFLLNQQHLPLRKAVRSQSYSIGQGDIENSPVGKFSAHLRTNVRHRPSKPSLLGESGVGLSQLREDDTDEVESLNGAEHGVRLPPGYWEREQNQALLKQAAVENARARNRATSTGSPVSQHRRKTTAGLRNTSYGTADYAIEEMDDPEANVNHPNHGLTRRFSEHVSVLGREHEVEIVDSPKKQQWATDNIPMLGADALGRRHSIAHYGSGYTSNLPISTLSNTQEEDEEVVSPRQESKSPEDPDTYDHTAYFAGYGPASRAINASAISAAHPDPVVPNPAMSAGGPNPYAVPHAFGRPGRRLFVVTFKCSRADIYYLFDNTGLEIRCGDLVIVEGDRGCDLGQVTHADISLDEARRHKAHANEEHFRWLVMFSQYSLAGTSNDSGMLGSLARANGYPNAMSGSNVTGMTNQPEQETKPKMIKRLAQQHEIMGLRDKEGQEAKAKRCGAQKAADHKLNMEILDAEYQADYHKLTYYYYAESYVNFNELVTDLFKQYKVRIWMSAINPASVINPAGNMQVQPPSAVGPGAIMRSRAGNSSYAVGPGFGNNNHRAHHQYGRNARQAPQGGYDDGYNAFSYQLPSYNPQANTYVNPFQNQRFNQQVYGNYPMQAGSYPTATASGSPMNYGGYYPPTTYGATPSYGAATSGPAYRGGYISTTGAGGGQASTAATAGPAYSQYASSYYKTPTTSVAMGGTTGSPGNGYTATSGATQNTGYDPLMAAMQNMSFGGK